jgi:hypothetical protein
VILALLGVLHRTHRKNFESEISYLGRYKDVFILCGMKKGRGETRPKVPPAGIIGGLGTACDGKYKSVTQTDNRATNHTVVSRKNGW